MKQKQLHRSNSSKILRRQKTDAEIVNTCSLYPKIDASKVKKFSDFPLSIATLQGLKCAGFEEPTEIQRESIGFALRGLDVLGAAITGSGKTLAFIIPIIEKLWTQKWTQMDGLGALIISPTRELALQTYEVLCKVGCKHEFSAALIIGGTDVSFQKERIARSNIIVCTPGRVLQHMDENPTFLCDNVQLLVLDEADRMLDMGFKEQLNSILDNLPRDKQTLLFSATQTKSVKDLARLSLKDPVYVSVHEHAEYSTPANLRQCYMVCEEHEKVNLLWSFLRNHLHSRIISFFTNCKQVRFVYEAFRRLRPGLTVLALHGSMNQMKRVQVYEEFCKDKHAALFATDIAARGLDFPDVDWVYQFDCPQDAKEYIHRSGRTARLSKNGESLLVLTPSQEKAAVEELTAKRVPIKKINVNRSKLFSIQTKLDILCAKDTNFKVFAQRAFVAYIRSVVTMSNKQVFDVNTIDMDALAKSYGMVSAPRVRFLRKQYNKDVLTSKQSRKINEQRPFGVANESDEETGDFLTIKSDNVFSDMPNNEFPEEFVNAAETGLPVSKRVKRLTKSKLASKLLKKNIRVNQKIVFNDKEEVQTTTPVVSESEGKDQTSSGTTYNIDDAKIKMAEEDKVDRKAYQERIKAKHREKRLAKKIKRKDQKTHSDEDALAILGGSGNSDDESVDLSFVPNFDKISNRPINDVKQSSDEEDTFEKNSKRRKRKFCGLDARDRKSVV